ncbi:hypothetical protein SLEP1_g35763 [Rubroshorea leprosula]|uniref:ATP-dependent Clp protease proteolytic subunit n=1 Tax=Rubroshorea leprosula TaxID=152421 RepID=A0AAV5KP94_9ROSI|nr:hypothetical protein SLEP1_g35763 [Rubroshorea leprosula]
MAASLLSPLTAPNPKPVAPTTGLPKSSFLSNTNVFFFKPRLSKNGVQRSFSPFAGSLDHIPKQFREENLKDGMMDNYKNVPPSLYGLSPSQMNMFLTEDSPIRRQSESVTEESISSAYSYLNKGGMYSLSGMDDKKYSRFGMKASMYHGGGGYGRPRTPPPDLPSLLLDARIVYLGMPIVPAVTELIVAQLMFLDYDDQTKPIYIYINSSGTLNEKMEIVGSETEAYAIADSMSFCKSKVHTLNLGMAFGQAAMLLGLGAKGHRLVQPHSSTKLHLPRVMRSSGPVTDMWIKAKELDANADYYLELLSKGTGKTKEELANDVQRVKYFRPHEAIEYGLADKIVEPRDTAFVKQSKKRTLTPEEIERRTGFGVPAVP